MSPKLDFCPAPSPNGIGVLVVPGGGYRRLVLDDEGHPAARWLNERGYDVWILHYTVNGDAVEGKPCKAIYPKPQQECLEAVRQIRSNGGGGRLPKLLGIWGFSAGGHLSAVTATDHAAALDFAILAYPVITLEGPHAHANSRRHLLGDDDDDGDKDHPPSSPSPSLIHELSAQNRVDGRTPPTFIFHTASDPVVPVQNALMFASAMAGQGRPFEVFVLPEGPHGVNLGIGRPKLNWMPPLERWLKQHILPLMSAKDKEG